VLKWRSVEGETLATASSSRPQRARPSPVATKTGSGLSHGLLTITKPASRSRFSRTAVAVFPVPAHLATALLGTTPKRATNQNQN
jgi:hypothetical protein